MPDEPFATAARPVRQKSANGKPKRDSEFTRRCQRCGADFIGLAFGKTGEVGLWDGSRGMHWWCSVECYNHDHPADRGHVSAAWVVALCLGWMVFFGVGVWAGESRVQHGVNEQACHLAGGQWAADMGHGKCVEVVHVGR